MTPESEQQINPETSALENPEEPVTEVPAPEAAAPVSPRKNWYWLALLVVAALIVIPYFRGQGRSGPASANDFLNQSMKYDNEGKFAEAIVAAQEALKLQPNSAIAYNNLAIAYQGLRSLDKAAENAETALRIEPNMQVARNNLANIRKEQQQTLNVLLYPKTAEDWMNRSVVLYQAGKFDECLVSAREAVKMKPDSTMAHNNVSACALPLGRFDEAIAEAQEAVRLSPDFQLAKNNLAYAVSGKAQHTPKK